MKKNLKLQAKESNYRILKKKWLLEILTERKISIDTEKGFLINNLNNHWSNKFIGNPILSFSHFFNG